MDRSSIPAWAMPRVAVPDNERRQAVRSGIRYQYSPLGIPVSGAVSRHSLAEASSPLQDAAHEPVRVHVVALHQPGAELKALPHEHQVLSGDAHIEFVLVLTQCRQLLQGAGGQKQVDIAGGFVVALGGTMHRPL